MTYYEGTRGDFFLGEFALSADGQPVRISQATDSYAKNRFGNHPVSASLTLDGDPQTGWSVDDRLGERHVAVYTLDPPLEVESLLELQLSFGRHFASSLGRFRLSMTDDSEARVAQDLPEDVEAALATPPEQRLAAQQQRLWEQFLLDAPELAKASAEIRQLRRPPGYPTTLVFRERPAENPRPTFVHHRGEYLQATEQVEPAVPEFLHALPADQPRNRLGFAYWLVADENPLTARVIVNRQWAALFGRGIVPTVEDFGHQGELPSHPALLDWLAVEFQEGGGSLKRLHRLIVTSATYRQSSEVSPGTLAADPENRWLARAPRPRLPAEVIRDQVLQASGLLSTEMGGPGVRPPQPSGVTEVAYGSPAWEASEGTDRYRRSIYTFRKRTAAFALYTTFDAPSGEACTARRDVSNTPLQALTLLNDVVFVEAARALGRRSMASAASDAQRVGFLFRRVLTRDPDAAEVQRMLAFVSRQRQRFAETPEAAFELAGSDDEHAGEHAAWTALARAVFCLDEAITRN
jgi:hypothetical protein